MWEEEKERIVVKRKTKFRQSAAVCLTHHWICLNLFICKWKQQKCILIKNGNVLIHVPVRRKGSDWTGLVMCLNQSLWPGECRSLTGCPGPLGPPFVPVGEVSTWSPGIAGRRDNGINEKKERGLGKTHIQHAPLTHRSFGMPLTVTSFNHSL